ncbi:MAG: DUF3179 domain-containing protein [Acidobacteria bacterium]|nr:DUF3179 domain-containing protein [Acidobacteriota bacterium]
MRARRAVTAATVTTLALLLAGALALVAQRPVPDIGLFYATSSPDHQAEALRALAAAWRNGYAGILLDVARFLPPADRQGIVDFLEARSGKRFGQDLDAWRQWIWAQPYDPHPQYAQFKSVLYGALDARFKAFFPPDAASAIRLDEIDWGGVGVNAIPPLEYPAVAAAREAAYLDDSHIVFGIAVNGEARAYPKRILAWHEMALDRLGGTELTVVYCTLCGAVIPYESVVDGRHITLGTSGLLYRSNKLMFDHETSSLWSTFEGRPVVGPLVGSGLRLRPRAVVTTTWKEWRTQHPDTTVLSLDTGYVRDYSEGAAYGDYFSTDRLMFQVPGRDARLLNKDEVLVLQVPPPPARTPQPLAIAAAFLARNRVYHAEVAGVELVVITSPDGANRVFDAGAERFDRVPGADLVADAAGRTWRVTEDALVLVDDARVARPRVPAQRAFWFGWRAQFPDTILIR